jgi:TRAP-type C4-dicarboxylate transport system permease small subunit
MVETPTVEKDGYIKRLFADNEKNLKVKEWRRMQDIFVLVLTLAFFWLGAIATWKIFNWFISLETAAKTSAFSYYLRRLFTSLAMGCVTAFFGIALLSSFIESQAQTEPDSLNIPVPSPPDRVSGRQLPN